MRMYLAFGKNCAALRPPEERQLGSFSPVVCHQRQKMMHRLFSCAPVREYFRIPQISGLSIFERIFFEKSGKIFDLAQMPHADHCMAKGGAMIGWAQS